MSPEPVRSPQGDDPVHTCERLARAFEAYLTALPDGVDEARVRLLARQARRGLYDEFLSDMPEPLLALVEHARDAGLPDIATRTINGEFDATQAESRAYFASDAGQKLLGELLRPRPDKLISGHHVGLWVTSEPTPDRSAYRAAMHLSEDYTRFLDEPAAHLHVRKIMEACAAAEYMAIVARQLIDMLGWADTDAFKKVVELRDFHGRWSFTASGLTLAPGLFNGGKAFLHVVGPDDVWWRWAPAQAKLHAQAVLEIVSAARWDLAWREFLINREGLADDQAELMVAGLRTHRLPEHLLHALPGEDEAPDARDRSSRGARERNRPSKKKR